MTSPAKDVKQSLAFKNPGSNGNYTGKRLICRNQTDELQSAPGNSAEKRFESTVIRQWSWLLKVHRVWGHFPYSFQRGNAGIEFKWLSGIVVYTLIVICARFVFANYRLSNWGIFLLGRSYEVSVEDLIVRSADFLFPGLLVWELMCTWIVLQKMKRFFNSWPTFECEFEEVFPGTPYMSKVSRWAAILVVLNVGCNALTVSSLWLIIYHHNSPERPFSLAWALGKLITLLMSNGEEMKKLMMYLSLAEAYRNIHNSIQVRIQDFETVITSFDNRSSQGCLSVKEISNWKKLILRLRSMVKLTGEIQTPHESVVLIHSVVIYTESLFILVKALVTQTWSNAAIIFGILSWSVLARLVAKIIFAQRITDQESRIADLLINMDSTSIQDAHAGNEVKKVIDMIRFSPAKISLGGFISLDKQLLPKISSYVVAYLVVLFQFHLSTKWKMDCLGSAELEQQIDSAWMFNDSTSDNITNILSNVSFT